MQTRTILSWILRLVAAIILAQTLFFKFSGAEESRYIFSTIGMEPWGRYLVGTSELVTVVLLSVGLAILAAAARPINKRRALLVSSMAAAYTLISAIGPLNTFFELDAPPAIHWLTMLVASSVGAVLVLLIAHRVDPRPFRTR